MRRVSLFSILAFGLAAAALAQPRGGILRVRLSNGTNGGEGKAEKATLLRLQNQMVPVKEIENVSGRFEIRDIVVEGERPMLLQVTSSGVNYNQPVRFGRGYEADVDVKVYDVVSRWNDEDFRVTTAQMLYRREKDRLLVNEIYVVENRTKPPRTYLDPDGTFRFRLPTSGLLQLQSVTAKGESGMPVPQQAAPLPDGSAYITRTAFKPGDTELNISYEVGYPAAGYELKSQAFYPLPELYVVAMPPDVKIDAEGWENLGPDPQGRFAAVRKRNVPVGAPIEVRLSGGSEQTGAVDSSEGESEGPGGTVTKLPDSTRFSHGVLVVLMTAALAYGLISALYPPPTRRG